MEREDVEAVVSSTNGSEDDGAFRCFHCRLFNDLIVVSDWSIYRRLTTL